MSNEFGYPHTGWNKPQKNKSVWAVFMSGLRRFMDEMCHG